MRNVLEAGWYVFGLALASLVSLGSLPAADWPNEIVYAETFEVSPGGTLRVEVPDADFDLRKGAAGTVRVEVRISGRDLERVRGLYEAMNFRAGAEGAGVSLDAQAPDNFDWRALGGFSIDVRVDLPEEFNVNLRVADGDVRLESLRGKLDVESSDGDVHVGAVRGPEARIESSDGDINVGELVAPRIVIRSSDGDLHADVLDGGDTRLASSDGDIVVGSLSGAAAVATSDGDIRVTIESLGATTLETHDGDITIEAPASLRAELSLSGDEVAVSASAGFEGQRSESRVEGRLNGGGPALSASSSDGSVRLIAR
jgi:hypothetical protein